MNVIWELSDPMRKDNSHFSYHKHQWYTVLIYDCISLCLVYSTYEDKDRVAGGILNKFLLHPDLSTAVER